MSGPRLQREPILAKPGSGKFAAGTAVEPANDASESRYRIWTAAEIWAELPPQDFLVDGVILRGSLAMVHAYGASQKSWIGCDLIVAAVLGASWLGRFPCKRCTRVLVIDWEQGSYELRRRLQLLGRGRGVAGAIEGIEFITMPNLFFTSEFFKEAIRELARDRQLIVFDSLASGSVDVDENDARFAHGLNALKALSEETGCTFFVIHHSRKTGSEGKKGDPRESGRGTGAIFNACDAVLAIIRNDAGAMELHHTKARTGPSVPPCVVRTTDVAGPGVTVLACDAADDDDDQKGPTVALQRAKASMLRALAGAQDITSKAALYRRVSGSKKTKIEALDELLEQGLVTIHAGAPRLTSEVQQ